MDRRLTARVSVIGGLMLFADAAVHAASLPDPTRPPDYAPYVSVEIPREVVDWKVNGITISPTSRSAILNGVVVVPGQRVGPATVSNIESNAVVLDYDGQVYRVELRLGQVKRPVSN